ncbi:hypothetical protein [Lewinella sp. JB7]|nr:hypothetical protein [Lewinella sp. JB7]MCP9235707.1 hypothetical protein [Lewinella sp. JB7]
MKLIKRGLPLIATATLLLLTSCNRGFGCPTNLSVRELVSPLLSLLP